MEQQANKRRKVLSGILVIAVAATALIGGTIAQFTDRDTSDTQILQAGTVDIALSDDANNTEFKNDIGPMAAGDTYARYVNLTNVGTLSVGTLTVAQENGGGDLIAGDASVYVSLSACDEAWVNGECLGNEYANLINNLAPKNWNSALLLDLPELAPTETFYFKFVTGLPVEAPNSYQNATSWLRYTFNGVQRGAINFNKDGTVVPIVDDHALEAAALTYEYLPDGSVRLNWSPVPGATAYRIDRSPNPSGEPFTSVFYGDGNVVIDKSVEPNTVYYYRVVTFGATKAEKTSSDWTVVATYMDMNTPVALTSSTGDGANDLNWGVIPGAAGYELERKDEPMVAAGGPAARMVAAADAPDLSWRVIASGPDLTSFKDEDVVKGRKYSYKLTVIGYHEERITSSPITVSYPLDTPVLSMTQNSLVNVTASWTAVENAVKYKLYRNDELVGDYTSPQDFAETLDPNGFYIYTVKAVSAYGVVAESLPKTIATDPRLPGNITITPTSSSLTITWEPAEGATEYRIALSNNILMNNATVTSVGTATSYTIPNLKGNSTYAIKLIVLGEGYKLSTSAMGSTTLASMPSVSISDITAETAKVTLLPNNNVNVQNSVLVTSSDPSEKPFTVIIDDKTALIKGLSPNTLYTVIPKVQGLVGTTVGSQVQFTTSFGGAKLSGKIVDSSPELSWSKVTDATFKLERASANFTNPTTVYEGQDHSFADTTAQAGKTYFYRLTTIVGGESFVGQVVSLSTPLEPVVVTAADLEDHVEINWSSPPGASTFEVTRFHGTDEVKLYTGTNLTFNDATTTVGEEYTYKVVARSATGQNSSGEYTLTIQLRPSTLSATTESPRKIALSWTPVARAQQYVLYRSDALTMEDATVLYQGSALTFNDLTVYPEEVYFYRVKALTNSDAGSSLSTVVEKAAGISTLQMQAVPTSPTQALISWNGANGLTNMTLEYSLNRRFTTGVQTIALTANPTTVTGLTPVETYYYRVSGQDTNGDIYYSQTASALQLLETPVITNVVTTTTSGVATWGAVTNAERYELQKFDNGNWLTVGSTTGTTFSASGLNASEAYTLRVKAFAGDQVTVSASYDFHTRIQSTALTLNLNPDRTVGLTWALAKHASYKIYRSTSSDFANQEEIYTGSALAYTDTTPPPGKNTYYKVVAEDAFGQQSSSSSFALIPLGPVTLNGVIAYPDLTFTWSATPGADEYVLTRNSVEVYRGTATSVTIPSPAHGSTAYYTVTAYSNDGAEKASNQYTAAVSPGDFVLTGVANHAFSTTVSWTLADGAVSYKLQRSLTSNFATITDLGDFTNAGSFQDSVAQQTTYYYRVIATGGNGEKTTSSVVTVTTPADQVVLNTSIVDAHNINLSWEPIQTASYYKIYKGPTAGALTELAQTNNASYTASSLLAGENYYFQVKAFKEDGSEAANPSAIVSAATPVVGVPNIITASDVSNVSTRVVTIEWQSVEGASSYNVKIRPKGASTWTSNYNVYSTTISVGNVAEGAEFEYQVTAIANSGINVAGGIYSYTTGLNDVSVFTALATAGNTVYLSWTRSNSSLVTGYQIERGTSASGPFTPVTTVSSTTSSYNDDSAAYATDYYYRIRMVASSQGNTFYSGWVSRNVITTVAPVNNFALTTVGPSSQTLTWDAITGATTLKLYQNNTLFATLDPALTGYTATNMSPATSYSWYLEATGVNGKKVTSSTLTQSTPWGAPELTLGARTSSTQIVTWPTTPNATYILQRSDTANFAVPVTVATLSSGSTYTYSGLTAGTRYYYRMQTQNTLTGDYSTSAVKFSTTNFASGPTVTSSSSSNPQSAASGADLTINHSLVTNADSYTTELSLDRAAVLNTKTDTTGQVTFTGLNLYTGYYVRITATNADGASATTAWLGPYYTSALAPQLSAATTTSLYEHGLTFNLNNQNGAAMGYRSEVYKPTDLTTPVYTSTSTIAANTNYDITVYSILLQGNTDYKVKVVWTGPNQSSDYLAMTTPSPNLEFTDMTKTTAPAGGSYFNQTLTWTPVPGATSYQIATAQNQPSGAQNADPTVWATVDGNTTSYTLVNASNLISYYMVRAQVNGEWGLWRTIMIESGSYAFTGQPYCYAQAATSTTADVYCKNTGSQTSAVGLWLQTTTTAFAPNKSSWNGTKMKTQWFYISTTSTPYLVTTFTPVKGDNYYIFSYNSGGITSSNSFHYYQP